MGEESVGVDGEYFCQCDKFSYLPISYGAQTCIPDPEVKDAGIINPKKGVTFNLRLGETDKIALKLKDGERGRKAPWHRVSWYKVDKGLRITAGRTRTPEGHFKTPNFRQQVVVQNIRPEDGGLYMAKLENYRITWYRNIAGHFELLQEDGDGVKYELAGRQLTVEKVPGTYVARLRGSLPGPSSTLITGEATFQAAGQ